MDIYFKVTVTYSYQCILPLESGVRALKTCNSNLLRAVIDV